jgi:putative sterol carrier protein
MTHVFQREQSKELDALYHFVFTGEQPAEVTVKIQNQEINVVRHLTGQPDITIRADSRSWLRFLQKDANIVWLIITKKVKVKGPIRLLKAFGRCFPS